MNYVFGYCDVLILCELVSFELMKCSNIIIVKVEYGVDIVWLVDYYIEDFIVSYVV